MTAATIEESGQLILKAPIVTSTEGSTYKYEARGAGRSRRVRKSWKKKGGKQKRKTHKRRTQSRR